MRSVTLSRTPAPLERASVLNTPPFPQVPTIRLTTATPLSTDSQLADVPSETTILAPKLQATSRKRLVPKKSKLSLLGGGKKEKGKDFSDIERRVGAASPTMGRSFDIYVDPADDPDIGEIVVLKKKKSRAGLDDLYWGALGDVTNTGKRPISDKLTRVNKPATAESLPKATDDEKEKWWTIGRGRKDTKEKSKDKVKTKSKERLKEASKENSNINTKGSARRVTKSRKSLPQEQTKNSETRQRSQSLDAGMIFASTPDSFATKFISVPMPNDDDDDREPPRRGHVRTNTSPSLYGARPTTPEGIAAVTQPSEDKERPRTGSIALRAMRSVRSLARISSWAQLKNTPPDDGEQSTEKPVTKTGNKDVKRERKKSHQNSRSSFEALKSTFGSVRKSIDLTGTIRSVSSQATAVSSSSDATIRHRRRESGASVSTIRYDSSVTTRVEPIIGRVSKSSGASTIRWNDQVDTTGERHSPGSEESASSSMSDSRRESKKRLPEGRRRPGLASLFPDLKRDISKAADVQEKAAFPLVAPLSDSAERESETSTTLLDITSVTSLDTPSRRVRPRPLSEQLLGRERPKGIIGDKDTGVIRILDDVTTNLACLINRLDLEATPTSSPVIESPRSTLTERSRSNSAVTESPAKKAARQRSMDKLIGTLKSYTHRAKSASTSAADLLGQRIAPWIDSNAAPEPETTKRTERQPAFRHERKGTWSPSSFPASYESAPKLNPLPVPSRSRSNLKECTDQVQSKPSLNNVEVEANMPSSFATFGKRRSNGSDRSMTSTKTAKYQKRGGRGSSISQNAFNMSCENDVFADISAGYTSGKRSTLGSLGSQSIALDPSDPNYDIPRELRILLDNGSDRDTSYSLSADRGFMADHDAFMCPLPPSPGTPPNMPLPPVESSESVSQSSPSSELNELNDEAFIASDDESETKKSFDFTAELRKLDCSRATDNQSFAMQLEEAFKTPRKYSLRGLGPKFGLHVKNVPDVPLVPEQYHVAAHEVALPGSPPTSDPLDEECFEDSNLTSHLSQDESHEEDICISRPLHSYQRGVSSRPSQGRLDLNFQFGGNASARIKSTQSSRDGLAQLSAESSSLQKSYTHTRSSVNSDYSTKLRAMVDFLVPLSNDGRNQSRASLNSTTSSRPMTLSDIIPPPSHDSRRNSYMSVSEEESIALQSIYAQADSLSEVSLSPETGVVPTGNAGGSDLDRLVVHSRQNSDVSFSGLSAYSEIRRGFEFGPSRPVFYPPPVPGSSMGNSLQVPHADWRNSLLSLGSVSSYGRVTRAGAKDPFGYSVPARPISDDMSYTVDDTFSFLRHDPMRQRVDSGASNFSFDSNYSHLRPDVHQRRSRRQVESIISVTSGPPVSLYNRGFNAGRTTLTWRQRTSSFESIASGFSAHHLGRPGIGDKMFESAREHGIPLEAISASPSQLDSSMNWQSSFDSVVDADRDQDSLIDETGRRSMIGSRESLFGNDNQQFDLRPPQFRPVSVYSTYSQGSPKRDDDTMISMLGGGFVRRRSIRSTLEGSPCARAEKRQQQRYLGRILTRIPSGENDDGSLNSSQAEVCMISELSHHEQETEALSRRSSNEASPERVQPDKKPAFTLLRNSEIEDQKLEATAEQIVDTSRLSAYDAQFGDNRMSLARKGLLERQSLEDCCLSAEGEDTTNTRQSLPVFRRPERPARLRSASTGQASSSVDTPPLSTSRSSTQFTGSQHSIDLDRLNVLLSNSTNVISDADRARLRRRGSGHRRRISEARASRTSSVYETIEEAPEIFGSISKDSLDLSMTQNSSMTDVSNVRWENEDVGPALRMIRDLQDEARLVVDASRSQWADTAYSIDAVQSFQPPRNPASWKALLEHSQKNYGPLPPELSGCARRARKASRPSPYPRTRVFTRIPVFQRPPAPANVLLSNADITERDSKRLQELTVDPNTRANVRQGQTGVGLAKPVFTVTSGAKKSTRGASPRKDGTIRPLRSSTISSPRKLMPIAGKRGNGKSPLKSKYGKENNDQRASLRADSLRFARPHPHNRSSAIPRTLRI
ncbi:uncharacterized protein FOMMEDRAFT_151360 [Fomitiporia mediterranea MF3/22]|uniref:uncharacterized protein n=1 Tax=Fomitiporia mediterranea (strain MF3/22) TaxID=694068 RepID=UPI00044090BD|nr:uncharacterized protein FOMMEDRAFT_151360 [Fomitiporia mediterranea MF3/22]EJD08498.1 hypothetical protein FOMMEDRAFT_151360 [Fomitiporia mediterranea MF3/22]